ncbi:MAG: hypothetical protein ACT4PI_08925 [Actinomycetota bacterium]
MPDYSDPRQATDEGTDLDVFEEADATSTGDGPERDPNAVRRPGRPHGDPDERPVDETVDTTAHVPEGTKLDTTELTGRDVSGRMTGPGLIGIKPAGTDQSGRTEDPRGVEGRRGEVGDGPPTRSKDRRERDEHGRYTGKTTPVDPDEVDRPDGSRGSDGFTTKFEAQSGKENPLPRGPMKEYTQTDWEKNKAAREQKNEQEKERLREEGKLPEFKEGGDSKSNKTEAEQKVKEGGKKNETNRGETPAETQPYDDPTMSVGGTPTLAKYDGLSERARAELEADPHGDGRGPRGPKPESKPDLDASQTPADKFSAQINPVDPRQHEAEEAGALMPSAGDLVTDPPQGSQLAGETAGSSAQQAAGDPLLDPNAWLGDGPTGAGRPVAPTAPTAPPPPDPVAAAEPVAPAPQVEPGPAAGQPGDFAAPAPDAEAPDPNRAAPEPDDGWNDDAI